MHATLPLLAATHFPAIHRRELQTLQVNLGYRCNQSCLHCHVNAGPNRTEAMDGETVDLVLQALGTRRVQTLDLTGGAPELNPHFRRLVAAARAQGVHVMDRCNLTILQEPGQEGLAAFLAAQRVEVVASLPCYSVANVDRQRGDGVFERSIAGLRALNALGYGQPGSGLVLNLVYNPQGPVLPPPQGPLEADYKRELSAHFGIVFNQLYALTNMPIQRFGSTLVSKGSFHSYLQLLKDAYQPHNLATVMCRTLLSVDWQGHLYDCDFNQMLGLEAVLQPAAGAGGGLAGFAAAAAGATNADAPVAAAPPAVAGGGTPIPLRPRHRAHLRDLLVQDPQGGAIRVADHCWGCTAGQGSSCGGALDGAAPAARAA